MSFRDLPPMERLAGALGDAENGLREAMHAMHDVAPDSATPADWYDRLGQLETLTRRLSDLIDETATLVRRMPTTGLYSTDGGDVVGTVAAVADRLLYAGHLMYAANRDVNTAWAHLSVLGVLDTEGGTS